MQKVMIIWMETIQYIYMQPQHGIQYYVSQNNNCDSQGISFGMLKGPIPSLKNCDKTRNQEDNP